MRPRPDGQTVLQRRAVHTVGHHIDRDVGHIAAQDVRIDIGHHHRAIEAAHRIEFPSPETHLVELVIDPAQAPGRVLDHPLVADVVDVVHRHHPRGRGRQRQIIQIDRQRGMLHLDHVEMPRGHQAPQFLTNGREQHGAQRDGVPRPEKGPDPPQPLQMTGGRWHRHADHLDPELAKGVDGAGLLRMHHAADQRDPVRTGHHLQQMEDSQFFAIVGGHRTGPGNQQDVHGSVTESGKKKEKKKTARRCRFMRARPAPPDRPQADEPVRAPRASACGRPQGGA